MKMLHSRSANRCAFLTTVFGLLAFPLGCGGEAIEAPNLATVTGLVTYRGKPLPGASVAFVPKGKTPGTGAFGVTDASGRYELTHRTRTPGVEPGTYVVSVSKMTLPDGSSIPEGQDAADVGAVQVIPPIYSDAAHERNPNQLIVPPTGGEINLNLK
jgi:hypothetical protein